MSGTKKLSPQENRALERASAKLARGSSSAAQRSPAERDRDRLLEGLEALQDAEQHLLSTAHAVPKELKGYSHEHHSALLSAVYVLQRRQVEFFERVEVVYEKAARLNPTRQVFDAEPTLVSLADATDRVRQAAGQWAMQAAERPLAEQIQSRYGAQYRAFIDTTVGLSQTLLRHRERVQALDARHTALEQRHIAFAERSDTLRVEFPDTPLLPPKGTAAYQVDALARGMGRLIAEGRASAIDAAPFAMQHPAGRLLRARIAVRDCSTRWARFCEAHTPEDRQRAREGEGPGAALYVAYIANIKRLDRAYAGYEHHRSQTRVHQSDRALGHTR